MKVGTTAHPKLKRLARLLDLPTYAAAGLLECLWQLTSQHAEAGDVGRFSDAEIADFLDWRGEAAALVAALTEAGWLDADPRHRLIVHHWQDHAPEFVRKRMKRRIDSGRDGWAMGAARTTVAPTASPPSDDGGQRPTAAANGALTIPSHTIPHHLQPSAADAAAAESGEGEAVGWDEIVSATAARGVAKAAEAVECCRSHGCTPAQAQAVLTHYAAYPGAWEAGALYERLRCLYPVQAAGDCWPPPAAEYAKAERRRHVNAVDAQRARERAEKDQAEAAKREAQRVREARHGPQVDALPREEARRILTERLGDMAGDICRRWKPSEPASGLARIELLAHYAEQEEPQLATT